MFVLRGKSKKPVALLDNADGNDTVSISVWRGEGARCVECCSCPSSLLVGLFMLM